MSNLALEFTRRLEAARQRRFAQQRARQDRLDELPNVGRLQSVLAMPAIKMHVTDWTVDEFGNRTRWAFQEGDHPL